MVCSALSPAKAVGELLPEAILPTELLAMSVSGLTIDSREVKQNNIFVAMPGVRTHGADYIAQAVVNGAVMVFQQAQSAEYSISYQDAVPVISIPELESTLTHIAGRFYQHPTAALPVVGVTGTNGKTTVTQLYAQLISYSGIACGVVGTLGFGVQCPNAALKLIPTGMTTPDPINTQRICAELMAMGSQQIVMEVSSHGLQQHRVNALFIDIAVFMNLTHDHLDYHGTMEAYGEAKAKLFSMPSVKHAVINIDDPFGVRLLDRYSSEKNIISFSVKKPADIYLANIIVNSGVTYADVVVFGKHYPLTTDLVGEFNLSNLLAILAVCYVQSEKNHTSMAAFVNNARHLTPVSGRMETIKNSVARHVVVDYAHTPDALKNALQSLQAVTVGRLWCVFGCGGDRDKNKRQLMAAIAEEYADHVVVTSDNPRYEKPEVIIADICQGFTKENHQILPDRRQAIHAAISMSAEGDTILIAGKGHEDYQWVNGVKQRFVDQNVARLALREMEHQYD